MTPVERRRRSKLAGSHPAYPHPVDPAAPPLAPADQAPPTDPAPPPTAPRPRAAERDDPARLAAAMARKTARDAAWGWSAARKRIERRTGEWAAAMAHARATGALPGVLREFIDEAAQQARAEVPAEVWHAAGLEPPAAR